MIFGRNKRGPAVFCASAISRGRGGIPLPDFCHTSRDTFRAGASISKSSDRFLIRRIPLRRLAASSPSERRAEKRSTLPGSVATLQEWSDMLSQCSLRHRFPVCSSGGNSNRKSSYWRLVGSVATLQECFDKLDRYGPRTLSRRSVQMAPI
jgi:hypothetical protein